MQKLFRSERSQCEQKPYPLCNLQRSLLIWKDNLPKTRFRCNFCSDKIVQTWFGPFQKPIRHGTFHFQQRSGAVLFRSRNYFESSIPSVNRSPIRYTFCDAPFHCPVQCEQSLKNGVRKSNHPINECQKDFAQPDRYTKTNLPNPIHGSECQLKTEHQICLRMTLKNSAWQNLVLDLIWLDLTILCPKERTNEWINDWMNEYENIWSSFDAFGGLWRAIALSSRYISEISFDV